MRNVRAMTGLWFVYLTLATAAANAATQENLPTRPAISSSAEAGSGVFWFRCTTSPVDLQCTTETDLLPALKVETAGPVTITVTTQTHGSMTLGVVDPCGTTIYSTSLDFASVATQSVTFTAAVPGIYRLKPGGDIWVGRFRFTATTTKFVVPSGTDWDPYPDAAASESGSYYFYVPAGTSTFTFRVLTAPSPETVSGALYDQNGALRLSVPYGTGYRSFTVPVPAGSADGFWRVSVTHQGDLRLYLAGIPDVFAETPGAWFMPNVTVTPLSGNAGDLVTGDTEIFCAGLTADFLTADDTTVLGTAALTSNSCSHFAFAVPNLPAGLYHLRVHGCGGSRIFAFVITAYPGPDMTVAKTHAGTFRPGGVGTYTISVSNAGQLPSTGTVTITDTLPPSLTATAMTGEGWTCDLPSVRCNRNDVLASGAAYPAITLTVNVAGDSPASITNSVTVAGGGDTTATNDTAYDATPVVALQQTALALTSAPQLAAIGRPVTITATISPSGATGNVAFTVDGVSAATVPVSSGTATLTVTFATEGSHTVDGTYSGDTNYAASSGQTRPTIYSGLRKGDMNGDGWPDIPLLANNGAANLLFFMQSTAVLGTAALPGLPDGYFIQAVADFDGDGNNDYVVRNSAGRIPNSGNDYEVALWLMNGASLKGIVDLPGLQHGFNVQGAGDFNGDGKPDILIRRYDGVSVWLMNGTSFGSIVDLPGYANGNAGPVGVADFNGDGMPDILWEDFSTGAVAIWLMNHTALLSIVDLPTLPIATGLNYQAVGVGDFNGDGKPDVLLCSRNAGRLAVWIMNGTAFTSIVDVPNFYLLSPYVMGPR